ncbi:MAG: CPBP family intramembrane glutamic endopeptidase [Algisphaera sp.]
MPSTPATPTTSRTTSRPLAALFLLLAAPVQFAGTWLAMVAFPGATWAKVAFGIAKVGLFLLPLVWLLRVERIRPRIPQWSNRGMIAAHATGLFIFATIAGVYATVGQHWIDAAAMREQIQTVGLGKPAFYLLGALYWCTINSLLEEYFWRWFIGERLRNVLPRNATGDLLSAFFSALLFTAHHVIALAVLFDAKTTALASTGVFIGGFIWSLLYLKYRNIYAGYISHVYADIIIFYLGWRILFG